jgi:arylsulfatase A-like enzyme
MNQPNVILLTLDTLRADMVGCYGQRSSRGWLEQSPTPHLDRMAARSVLFQNAITGGSWTQAAFPPLLTSTYASMYGGCLGRLSPQRPSPVEALARAGYRTAAFSTSPLLSRKYGYDRGFEQFEDILPQRGDPALRRMKGGQALLRQPWLQRVGQALGADLRPAAVYGSAEELTQKSIDWLREAGEPHHSARPYFLWAHYMDVHWPYHLEEDLENPRASAQAWRDLAHLYEVNWHGATVSEQQRTHYVALYERALAYLDRQLGRLFAALEELGQVENTLLIIVSDHGEEFLERKHWGHFETNLHDEILRVPLLMRLPGQSQGRVVQSQVRTLDIMPTVLELCRCPAPEGMEGESVAPLWAGNGEAYVYKGQLSISEMWRDERHIVALRTDQFKYLWDSHAPERPRLFNLAQDPQEQQDRSGDEPALAARFQEQVDNHRQRAAATAPATAALEPEMDQDLLNRLRDLGYVR